LKKVSFFNFNFSYEDLRMIWFQRNLLSPWELWIISPVQQKELILIEGITRPLSNESKWGVLFNCFSYLFHELMILFISDKLSSIKIKNENMLLSAFFGERGVIFDLRKRKNVSKKIKIVWILCKKVDFQNFNQGIALLHVFIFETFTIKFLRRVVNEITIWNLSIFEDFQKLNQFLSNFFHWYLIEICKFSE